MNEVKMGDLVHVTAGDYKGEQGRVDDWSSGIWHVKLHSGAKGWFEDARLERIPDPAPDLVSHPTHYTDGTPPGIEVIDIIRAHMAAGGTWETGNALKYILRHTLKGNPAQDIAKAAQYLTMWTKQQETT